MAFASVNVSGWVSFVHASSAPSIAEMNQAEESLVRIPPRCILAYVYTGANLNASHRLHLRRILDAASCPVVAIIEAHRQRMMATAISLFIESMQIYGRKDELIALENIQAFDLTPLARATRSAHQQVGAPSPPWTHHHLK